MWVCFVRATLQLGPPQHRRTGSSHKFSPCMVLRPTDEGLRIGSPLDGSRTLLFPVA